MKLYYIANARMPSEKAHGIQIAKMCEAFIEQGVDVTLVVPTRGNPTKTVKEFYDLRVEVPIVYLSVPDWYLNRFGFLVSGLCFMLTSARFLKKKYREGESFQIYSVDMDTFSYALLPRYGTTVIEMHSPKKPTLINHYFFKKVAKVIATNTLIMEALQKTFLVPDEKCMVAPNGFDIPKYEKTKEEARKELGIDLAIAMAVYVGRVFLWKGMEILPQALHDLPDPTRCYLVGVTEKELKKLSGGTIPQNFVAVGERPSSEIHTWLAAADIGLVLGTKENESSFRYTSPMKVFEYMGARLPIVASSTPALKDVLTENEAFFYIHDNPESLREVVLKALNSKGEALEKARKASVEIEHFSWKNRAKTILEKTT